MVRARFVLKNYIMNIPRGSVVSALLLLGGAGLLYWMTTGEPEGTGSQTPPAVTVAASTAASAPTGSAPAPAVEPAIVLPPPPTPTELAQAALLAGGTLELVLIFPAEQTDLGQPVLTTGFTGRGDSLYVNCLPDGQVRFGWDHWGSQPILSAPVNLPRDTEQRVRISLGRKIEGIEPMPAKLSVWLNGEPVFSEPVDAFPCTADLITFGENKIGMSTSQAKFFGQLVSVTVVAAGP